MPVRHSLFKRLCTHLCTTRTQVRQLFSEAALDQLEQAIQAGENAHHGELRLVIEGSLPLAQVWARVSPRERAEHVFRELDIWDTEANSGVLLYLNIADHAVEIVADRGFNAKVAAETWQTLCTELIAGFRAGRHVEALHATIGALHALAREHFPAQPGHRGNANELPDRPVLR